MAISVPSSSVSAQLSERALFTLVCVFLACVLLVPICTSEYLGMPDYVNHMARAQLIVDHLAGAAEHPYFHVREVLLPNLALDLVVPWLVHHGMGIEDAMRLFAAVSMLLPLVGVVVLSAVLQGATPWIALLAFPMAFNRYFAWGFLNYFFSVGLALLCFALWVRVQRSQKPWPDVLQVLAFSALGFLVLVSHLSGFGVLGLAMAGYGASVAFGAAHRKDAGRWKPLLRAMAVGAVCAVSYLLLFERGLNMEVNWHDWLGNKVRGVMSPFIAYDLAPGLFAAALVTATLGYLAWRRELQLMSGWAWTVGLLALAFMTLPSVLMGSFYAERRLFIAIAWLGLAFLALRGAVRPGTRNLLIAVAMLATLAKTWEVGVHWREASHEFTELRASLAQLPTGTRLVTQVLVSDKGPASAMESPPVRHAGAFAVMDRAAYIPSFFGFPFNGESVAFRPEMLEATERIEKDRINVLPNEPLRWELICRNADYVLIVLQRPAADLAPPCAQPFIVKDSFVIFKVSDAGR